LLFACGEANPCVSLAARGCALARSSPYAKQAEVEAACLAAQSKAETASPEERAMCAEDLSTFRKTPARNPSPKSAP
jgi:uncharacterized membrane protein